MLNLARAYGAKASYTFNRVILLMLKPALTVQLSFTFAASWNSCFPRFCWTKPI